MGLIRGSLLYFVCIVLFLVLLAGSFFWTLSLSLNYDILKTELKPVMLEVAEKQMNLSEKIHEEYPSMISKCQNNTQVVYNDTETKYSFTFPCGVVLQGSSAVLDKGIDDLIQEVYYSDYDCNFWNCMQKLESPFFLVSEKAKDYWKGKFYLSLFVCLILAVLVFFLVETKSNLLIIFGSLAVLSSLVFIFLQKILIKLALPPIAKLLEGIELSENYLDFLFVKSSLVFWIILILGILLVGLGISFKIWDFGFSLFNKNEKPKKDKEE